MRYILTSNQMMKWFVIAWISSLNRSWIATMWHKSCRYVAAEVDTQTIINSN